MKNGTIALLVNGEQIKTLLYAFQHYLPPDDFLTEEDIELLKMLEGVHEELYPSKENEFGPCAIDDLPF